MIFHNLVKKSDAVTLLPLSVDGIVALRGGEIGRKGAEDRLRYCQDDGESYRGGRGVARGGGCC